MAGTLTTINSIFEKMGASDIVLGTGIQIVLSPYDIIGVQRMKEMNPLYDPTTYVCRYEAFEIRTIDGRVHANILTGTIDITDVDFIRFDTDVDTNQGIPVLGSPVSEAQNIITESNALGVDILFPAADVNNPKFKFIRSISVRYTDIVSIEFIKLPSIAR